MRHHSAMQDTCHQGVTGPGLGSVKERQTENALHRGVKLQGVLFVGPTVSRLMLKRLAAKSTNRDARQTKGDSPVDTSSQDAGPARSVPESSTVIADTSHGKKRRRAPASKAAGLEDKPPKHAEAKVAKAAHSKDVASGIKIEHHESVQTLSQLDGIVVGGGATAANAAAAAAVADKDQIKGQDKYCHFCQHVKINMLACTTLGCTHRYVA